MKKIRLKIDAKPTKIKGWHVIPGQACFENNVRMAIFIKEQLLDVLVKVDLEAIN